VLLQHVQGRLRQQQELQELGRLWQGWRKVHQHHLLIPMQAVLMLALHSLQEGLHPQHKLTG
jgi:hypothetical protein